MSFTQDVCCCLHSVKSPCSILLIKDYARQMMRTVVQERSVTPDRYMNKNLTARTKQFIGQG